LGDIVRDDLTGRVESYKPHLLFRKRRAEMEGRASALRAWDEFDRHGSPAPL